MEGTKPLAFNPIRLRTLDKFCSNKKTGREPGSPSLEESVNVDENILPAAKILSHKVVLSPSTALPTNADDVQSTDHQELFTSQENGCSSDESSCGRDAETKSECSCQEMANEVTSSTLRC